MKTMLSCCLFCVKTTWNSVWGYLLGKSHSLISKLFFQMQRPYYLLVTRGEVHDCCLTVYQEAFKPQCWVCSRPAAPLFILTHWQCWELAPAICQMLVQSTLAGNQASFCSILLWWRLWLLIHTSRFLALHFHDYSTAAGKTTLSNTQ